MRYLLPLFIWLCLPLSAHAENPPLQIVTAPEVKYMLEKGNSLLIHSLSKIEYDLQHIPGSINIPVVAMRSTDQLPEDKNTRLIFYCMGSQCSYSERACKAALAMGYAKVYWFRGGIPEWRRFNYPMADNPLLNNIKVDKLSPHEVNALLAKQEIFILDVRPLWWKVIPRSLRNARFMPLVKLQNDYVKLPKDQPLLIIDGYMKQSPSAARFLSSKGYRVAGVLKGGIGRWEKEGYPVEEHPQ